MLRRILTTVLSFFAATAAFAQPEGRVFTVLNQAYANLNAPTVITTANWDDFNAKVPLGFNFTFLGMTTDSLHINSDYCYGGDFMLSATAPANIMSFGADLIDRLGATGVPSEVSYKIDVVNNKKIAKLQWKDVGFIGDQTSADSANFQVWLYEGSNTLEVHYGPSSVDVSNPDLFDWGNPTYVFYKNADFDNFTLDWMYYVSAVTPATVDSLDMNGMMNLTDPIGLNAYPANGTVFRFAFPTPSGIDGLQLNAYASVYPTLATTECNVVLSKNNFNGTIVLADMSGKIVRAQKATGGKNRVDMSGLPSGNYVLGIRSAEESVFYKITKQ